MTPKLAWYGDDFTGSAAVMEVLAFAGLRAILFSDIPSQAMTDRFRDLDAVGIASTARTHDSAWMERHLPAPLQWLHDTGAEILHYKYCSTLDSAAHSGNIGKAIDLGLSIRPAQAVPLVTAAPQMRRYQAFGHLFAGDFDGVHRLDRHPVMARHPVTPMREADVLAHLAGLSTLDAALIDLEMLGGPDPQAALVQALDRGARLLSFDNMSPETEAVIGKVIWHNRCALSFAAGSQGLEYALVRHWQTSGALGPSPAPRSAPSLRQIAAVSGSVSPSTARQIAWGAAQGFAVIAFDTTAALADPAKLSREVARVVGLACDAAQSGNSPLIVSARGPDDPMVARFWEALSGSRLAPEQANARIGQALGQALDQVLRRTGLRRAVISGGDTSGHGMRALGIEALEALAPTIPGAALNRAHGVGAHDGLELALKGGQMGSEDFFGWIRAGGGPR
ncbi:hypothetical protein AQS8620_00826 [Aquimixticola soesokkakensis]|uniref:Uncharacterized protein n=1 Tax=Aquimixticola soesokkakensis TaxID=1519096 RepID=A0A1Y5RWU4_9RHOB|nr:four-carbon acid sugar kinase family protein [Aquimixticola soesokkakensis]SLN27131.1 hypothetical protein AQS8620_00826 [Aquimixticola soesokkakensis]